MYSGKKNLDQLRQDALTIFRSALTSVHGETAVHRAFRIISHQLQIAHIHFDLREFHHIHVIGFGKASAHMAKAVEGLLGHRIQEGRVIVKYGHGVPLKKIKIKEAAHPLPDENSCQAAQDLLQYLQNTGKNDLVICLISGGGSALLCLPMPPLTLSDKQQTIQSLLSCGATIDEINTVRKHMSWIKGGRLAQRVHPATLVSLIISDVIGDRLDVIASGPTVADPTTFQDCLKIIEKYQLEGKIPKTVMEFMQAGYAGKREETPKPGDPAFLKSHHVIVARNSDALTAAKKQAEALGYQTIILSSSICGNTRDAALFHTAIAREIRSTGNPLPPPACILSGGETTVQVNGHGLGGRNQEFALAAAIDIYDQENMVILSAGTDGTDGPTDAAGARVDPATATQAMAAGKNPIAFLTNHDSYHFFKSTDHHIITGPTGTNVMDVRILLIG